MTIGPDKQGQMKVLFLGRACKTMYICQVQGELSLD